MYRILGIFVLSLMVVACSNAQEGEGVESGKQEKAVITLVPADKFKELMKDEEAQLLDVRTPEEYSRGKIGDAVNMNFFDADFKEQVATLDKSKPVLIYCAAGGRSAKVVSIMEGMGFKEIHELKGGYGNWK